METIILIFMILGLFAVFAVDVFQKRQVFETKKKVEK